MRRVDGMSGGVVRGADRHEYGVEPEVSREVEHKTTKDNYCKLQYL
jgi:hypothetical protein